MALAVPHLVQYLLGPGSTWRDAGGAVLDGAVVAFLFYRVLLLIRGTRAINVLLGLLVLGIGYLASQWANLVALNWLLGHFLSYSFIFGVIVLFQADIRRGLARLGRRGFLVGLLPDDRREQVGTVDALARAVAELARRRRGALIVVERTGDLGEVIETGVRLDAAVSTELIVSLFQAGAPLHDGAVVVQRGRMAAARCLLPLATTPVRDAGTRHRAALGLSEEVDAAVLVVSEERSEVSIAVDGRLHRALGEEAVREMLASLLTAPPARRGSWLLERMGHGRGRPPARQEEKERDRAAV